MFHPSILNVKSIHLQVYGDQSGSNYILYLISFIVEVE